MFSVLIIIGLLLLACLLPINYPLTSSLKHNVTCRGGYNIDYQSSTAMRGVAILLILVGHISGTFSTVVFTPLASAGVSLFLILSGYGLSESFKRNGLTNYWPKKITRVLFPYAIVITILIVFSGNYNPLKYFMEITGVSTSYWYVGYQMKWYLVFFITMLLLPRYRLIVFSVLGIVMFLSLNSLEIEQSATFIIGIVLSDKKEYLSKVANRRIIYIAVAAFFIATLCLGLKQLPLIRSQIGGYTFSFIQMLQNVFYAMFIISYMLLLPHRIRNSSFLIFCGIISYEVYLLHFPFYSKVGGSIILSIGLIICSLLFSALLF